MPADQSLTLKGKEMKGLDGRGESSGFNATDWCQTISETTHIAACMSHPQGNEEEKKAVLLKVHVLKTGGRRKKSACMHLTVPHTDASVTITPEQLNVPYSLQHSSSIA